MYVLIILEVVNEIQDSFNCHCKKKYKKITLHNVRKHLKV